MNKANLETIVGIFVLIGILSLGYLSIKLGKLELLGGDYYEVYAEFDSVSGLKKGASVEIAGVEIGRTDRITLNTGKEKARVTMRIRRDVNLQEDVIASVRTRGIIGDKFVRLKPGGSDVFIKPGGRVRESESSIDLEELVSEYIHGKVE